MACPCFEPGAPLPWHVWLGRFRPPLGRPYRGICRAKPGEGFEPDEELLVSGCNLGYARAVCRRVPASAPDAVRLTLASPVTVRWSLERSHLPEAFGTAHRGAPTGQGTVIDKQVEAYFQACDESRGLFSSVGA